ncbi:hypothetical protein ANACOL_02332 [Anaerotruncus colihominis DSM 17241]|uniref:Uncharacterized protein n=1 Tax=Anaerotruncus colihominis DSM 17241 TaxID=445972 RepID=B0PC23_9FIRM|nr:hypothetical protein ANACOL_02332 [Anaerotruncus colihominis DSM 17241]
MLNPLFAAQPAKVFAEAFFKKAGSGSLQNPRPTARRLSRILLRTGGAPRQVSCGLRAALL